MTCILVMGTPRSGTSAIAGALNHMRIPMGKFFTVPNEGNPKGFWEDNNFVNINVALLASELSHPQLRLRTSTFRQARKLLEERQAEYALWGVKDPRFCFTFPLYAVLLGDDLKVILTLRDIEHTALSMNRLFSVGVKRTTATIEGYKEAINYSLEGYTGPRLDVQFDDLMGDPASELQRIAEFVDVPLTDAAIAFIDPSMRHW